MMNKDDKMVFFVRNSGETTTVSISAQSSLVEAVEAFERFLRGAGYYFDERLDFVPAEEDKLGSAYEEDDSDAIVFGSSDWEDSINLDLQNMGAAGPTFTVSDDIDFSNINLDLSVDSSEPSVKYVDTDNHNDYYYDLDRHGRDTANGGSSIDSSPWPIYTAEQIREKYSAHYPSER